MGVIAQREFFHLFKGIKSIIIVAILFVTAYYSAKFSNFFLLDPSLEFTSKEAEDIHVWGIIGVILLFGQLFVMGLSHDTINRETHERTARFLVTRTSRASIIVGKFLGILLFWFVCVTIAFLLTSIFSKKFNVFIFSQTISLLTYQIALTILLSVLLPKPGFTMFLGVLLGIASPIFGFWVWFTQNEWVSWLKYINPYYYLFREDNTFLLIFLMAGMMLFIAHFLFQRRGC